MCALIRSLYGRQPSRREVLYDISNHDLPATVSQDGCRFSYNVKYDLSNSSPVGMEGLRVGGADALSAQ
jgi:hypothetical protein